jgi:hypothetical protein
MTALLFILVPSTAGAQAEAGLDQHQLERDIAWAIHSHSSLGQWMTVGADGLLSAAEFSLYIGGQPTEDLVVEVYDFTAGMLGALRGSTSVSPSDLGPKQIALDADAVTATLIPFENLGIMVGTGETIAILFTTAATTPDFYGVDGISTDSYPNGERITASGVAQDLDLMFKTFVARPVFDDGFESGNTSVWSSSVGAP